MLSTIILNLVGAFIIIGGAVFGILWYLRHTKVEHDDSIDAIPTINKTSIQDLVMLSARSIGAYLRQDFSNQNLSELDYNNKLAAKKRLRNSISQATYGDPESKAIILEYIKSIITTNAELRISEGNIDDYIPFESPDRLKPQDKFLILLSGYKRAYGSKGFDQMFKESGWAGTDTVEKATDITDEMVIDFYNKALDFEYCTRHDITTGLTQFTYDEKLDYLSQEILQNMYCLGVPDRLFEMDIDEIDIGVSGIPSGSFQIGTAVKNFKFSYDAIWVMYHGYNIHLSVLSCGSEEELERICDNAYKYNAPHVLSEKEGYVVSSMKNGSRVVVVRPKLSDKYALFVRKFDSAPSVAPEKLIKGPGSEMVRIMSEWFVRGERNIAITGQQATGKTTMLKSFIGWIENLNIRVQELAAELNLSFTYPEKNIVALQETDTVDAQAGLNVQKKMNGAVNIIGEVANAIQASHIIQTANVASRFALFTHHAKSSAALVNMIALNLLQIGLYKEKRDAVEISAQTLNINIHLENTDSYRHIEYIDEIIPVTDELYYSQKMEKDEQLTPENYTEQMHWLDARDYYIRQTDRHLFEVNNLIKWNRIPGDKDPTHGFYTLEHMPSEETLYAMRNVLTTPDLKERFDNDMNRLQEIDKQIREEYKEYIA